MLKTNNLFHNNGYPLINILKENTCGRYIHKSFQRSKTVGSKHVGNNFSTDSCLSGMVSDSNCDFTLCNRSNLLHGAMVFGRKVETKPPQARIRETEGRAGARTCNAEGKKKYPHIVGIYRLNCEVC